MPDQVAAQGRTATPGQTVGPFFHYALPYPGDRELAPRGSAGAVRLHGTVRDGAGAVVPDALLEIRQAGPDGVVPQVSGSLRRDGAGFTGWGRSHTDPAGHYWFSTLEPGAPRPGAAPHLAVTVLARGLLNRLFTRVYLPAPDEVLAADPLLAAVTPAQRRAMVAVREADGSLRWDLALQGDDEPAFLTFPGHRGSG